MVKNQLIAISKVAVCLVIAWLYAWGGSDFGDKIIRRLGCPVVFCGAMFAYTRDWKVFIQLPLCFGSLSLGYGADTTAAKIARRAIFGAANGVSTSLYNILKKNWLLVGTQIGLLVLLYIIFGVWNPLPEARTEEVFLGLNWCLIPLMGAKRRT